MSCVGSIPLEYPPRDKIHICGINPFIFPPSVYLWDFASFAPRPHRSIDPSTRRDCYPYIDRCIYALITYFMYSWVPRLGTNRRQFANSPQAVCMQICKHSRPFAIRIFHDTDSPRYRFSTIQPLHDTYSDGTDSTLLLPASNSCQLRRWGNELARRLALSPPVRTACQRAWVSASF